MHNHPTLLYCISFDIKYCKHCKTLEDSLQITVCLALHFSQASLVSRLLALVSLKFGFATLCRKCTHCKRDLLITSLILWVTHYLNFDCDYNGKWQVHALQPSQLRIQLIKSHLNISFIWILAVLVSWSRNFQN